MSQLNPNNASSLEPSSLQLDDYSLITCSVGAISWSLPSPIKPTDSEPLKQWKANTTLNRLDAIHSSKVNAHDKFQAMGTHLNLSTQVSAMLSEWHRTLQNHWQNPKHFKVLGFFGSDGTRLNSTTTAADSQILLPIDQTTSRTNAQRRSADVKWVRVQLRVQYSALDSNITPPDNPVYDYSCYIELPQETKSTLNSTGNSLDVTTFWGPDDLRTIDASVFKSTILSAPPSQRFPYDLLPPVPPSTLARHDNGAVYEITVDDILTVMFSGSRTPMMKQVTPIFSGRPVDQLRSVFQCIPSSSGGPAIVKPVHQYMTEFYAAIATWANDPVFPLDVHNECFRNMDSALKKQLEADNYQAHLHPQSLSNPLQMTLLAALQTAAMKAERTILRTEEQVSQFLTRQNLDAPSHHAAALKSQAERTLDHYRPNPRSPKPPECWHKDCQGEHRFGPDCPYFNTPGAEEKVEQGRKAFYKKVNQAKRLKRGFRGGRSSYQRMSKTQKALFAKHLSARDVQEISQLHYGTVGAPPSAPSANAASEVSNLEEGRLE